jgi:hypothetical protein
MTKTTHPIRLCAPQTLTARPKMRHCWRRSRVNALAAARVAGMLAFCFAGSAWAQSASTTPLSGSSPTQDSSVTRAPAGKRGARTLTPGFSGVFQAGVGAVVPIAPSGGAVLSLGYVRPSGMTYSVFGALSAGSVDLPPRQDGDQEEAVDLPDPVKAGLVCSAGAAVGWTKPRVQYAPSFSLGVGWGYVLVFNDERSIEPFKGSGLVVSAQGGYLSNDQYYLGAHVDFPTFEARGPDGKLFAMAAVAQAGMRLW